MSETKEILSIFDRCCDAFRFPMLDNGYVYLAATRLALYRSRVDWAIVIEVFGFSPRAGLPDTCIQTFASSLRDRDPPERYVNREAYERYLANNPHNDARYVFPVHEGAWQDEENGEFVADDAQEILVRNQAIRLPSVEQYQSHDIQIEQAPRAQVFELCRFLAEVARNDVLATEAERRVSVFPEMEQLLQLEEWHHQNWRTTSGRANRKPSSNSPKYWLQAMLEFIAHRDRQTRIGGIGPKVGACNCAASRGRRRSSVCKQGALLDSCTTR